MMRFTRVLFLGALVGATVTSACVRRGARAPERGGHDLITQAELERAPEFTLYETIRKLRPHFLRNRSSTAVGKAPSRALMLYVNGEKMDSIDDLRRLSPAEVHEVRFYEPQLANLHFARYNNAGGAIAVTLKKLDGTF
jgi:hypothetical protein